MSNIKLSENLVYYRKKNKLSQEQLADKLHVSRQAISRWECGDAIPDTENLIELSSLYNVSLDDLVKGIHTDYDYTASDTEAEDYTVSDTSIKDHIKKHIKLPSKRSVIIGAALSTCITVLAVVAFIVWGFLGTNAWAVAWVTFLAIPLVTSFALCIKTKKVSAFCFPVLAVAAYFLASWYTGMWHPLWIIFLSIPLFYSISGTIDKLNGKSDDDKDCNNNCNK